MSGYQYPQGYPNPQTQAQVPQFPGFPGAAPASAAGYAQAGYPAPAHAQPPATAGYPPQPPGVGPVWQAPGPGVPAVPGYGGPVPAPAPQPAYAPAPQAQYPPQVQPAAAGGLPPSYTDVISHDFARVNISFNPAAPYPAPTPVARPVANPVAHPVGMAPVPTSGVWRLLQHGSAAHFYTACGGSLGVNTEGGIYGSGTQTAADQFYVEHVPEQSYDIVKLRNVHDPGLYIHSIKGNLMTSVGTDNTALFRVHCLGGNTVSLESAVTPGDFIGIKANGDTHHASQAMPGNLKLLLVTPAGQIPPMSDSVTRVLRQTPRIHLLSVATQKTLQILNSGEVKALGGSGNFASFDVEHPVPNDPHVVRLRNVHNPAKYLSIAHGELRALGGEHTTALLRVLSCGGDFVRLESVTAPGEQVQFNTTGTPRPSRTPCVGRINHFQVQISKQQKPAVAAVPVAPTAAAVAGGDIWGLLQHEAKIHLVSAASKKSLRILAGGEVNGQGGQGAYATFHVEHPQSLPHDIIRLRNANNPAFYLNIMQGQLLASNGATNTSLFRVIPHGGSVISLESVSFPGQHVGVLPNGRSKPSANTGRGPHGQFTVQPAGQAPGQVDVWGMLLPEARIRLVSAASGKTLRILGDGRVNGLGGNGQAAMFFVELPQTHGPGIIRLRNANNPQFYLNILQGQLKGSNGATDTSLLRVHAHGGDLISLESLSSHGQHVGILPSGQPKPATGTGRGKHGQFIVQRAA